VKTFRIVETQDGCPAVVVDRYDLVMHGAVEHKGDLVDASLQRDAEAAVLHGLVVTLRLVDDKTSGGMTTLPQVSKKLGESTAMSTHVNVFYFFARV
jgi:hypothetical protein